MRHFFSILVLIWGFQSGPYAAAAGSTKHKTIVRFLECVGTDSLNHPLALPTDAELVDACKKQADEIQAQGFSVTIDIQPACEGLGGLQAQCRIFLK